MFDYDWDPGNKSESQGYYAHQGEIIDTLWWSYDERRRISRLRSIRVAVDLGVLIWNRSREIRKSEVYSLDTKEETRNGSLQIHILWYQSSEEGKGKEISGDSGRSQKFPGGITIFNSISITTKTKSRNSGGTIFISSVSIWLLAVKGNWEIKVGYSRIAMERIPRTGRGRVLQTRRVVTQSLNYMDKWSYLRCASWLVMAVVDRFYFVFVLVEISSMSITSFIVFRLSICIGLWCWSSEVYSVLSLKWNKNGVLGDLNGYQLRWRRVWLANYGYHIILVSEPKEQDYDIGICSDSSIQSNWHICGGFFYDDKTRVAGGFVLAVEILMKDCQIILGTLGVDWNIFDLRFVRFSGTVKICTGYFITRGEIIKGYVGLFGMQGYLWNQGVLVTTWHHEPRSRKIIQHMMILWRLGATGLVLVLDWDRLWLLQTWILLEIGFYWFGIGYCRLGHTRTMTGIIWTFKIENLKYVSLWLSDRWRFYNWRFCFEQMNNDQESMTHVLVRIHGRCKVDKIIWTTKWWMAFLLVLREIKISLNLYLLAQSSYIKNF